LFHFCWILRLIKRFLWIIVCKLEVGVDRPYRWWNARGPYNLTMVVKVESLYKVLAINSLFKPFIVVLWALAAIITLFVVTNKVLIYWFRFINLLLLINHSWLVDHWLSVFHYIAHSWQWTWTFIVFKHFIHVLPWWRQRWEGSYWFSIHIIWWLFGRCI
jgi:hypothetical protein